MGDALRILGIDPGLNRTGYGVIAFCAGRYTRVCSGVIRVPAGELSTRLGYICSEILRLIDENAPNLAAIEKTFLNTNAQSSMLLAHARGAAMAAVSLKGLACREFSTREIKKSVTGYGAADKAQIQAMVAQHLGGGEFSSDEADAIATAICCANTAILKALLPAQKDLGVSGTATARKGGTARRARSEWTKKYNGVM